MYQTKLTGYFSRLPFSEVASLTLRIGESARDLITQHKIIMEQSDYRPSSEGSQLEPHLGSTIDEAQEQIEEVLEDLGFGDEYTYARVHAYSAEGKHIRSVSLRHRIPQEQEHHEMNASAAQELARGMVAMASEVRRTLATVTATLEARETAMSSVLESMIEAKHDQIAAEGEAMAYHLAMEAEQGQENNDIKARGLEVLQQIAGTFMQGGIDLEAIKSHIKSNPEVVREFAKDPEVVDAISNAFFDDEG